MSSIGQRDLTYEQASLLWQCGSFWPDSMVDKSSFMKMLAHVLNVEAQPDIRMERWEEELTASGACNASGVVDVKNFVAFCMEEGIERAENMLGVLSRPPQQDERVAAPSEPSNERLAATNTKPGSPSNPAGRDGKPISSPMSMASAVFNPS
eukprot:3174938-Amphidinium_carterae.1